MKQVMDLRGTLSKAMIFALLWLVAVQPDSVIAKIYKYKDENGKTHFTDDPSNIPMRYRKKDSMDSFRGVSDPTPDTSSKSSKDKDKDKSKSKKKAGLSSQDVSLIKKTIQVLKAGVALGEKYKNTMPTFPNALAAVNAINSALPLKESLASDLEGTKVSQLQGALSFLKKSISTDKQTQANSSGLKRQIANIFARLVSEGEQQSAMINGLEKALKDSKKKKAEAKKKAEEEAKQKKEQKEAEKKSKEENETKVYDPNQELPEGV